MGNLLLMCIWHTHEVGPEPIFRFLVASALRETFIISYFKICGTVGSGPGRNEYYTYKLIFTPTELSGNRYCHYISTIMKVTLVKCVFARSKAGILGSNPNQDMDVCVCVYSICIALYVGSGLATGWTLA
jgi:hypothetical protein